MSDRLPAVEGPAFLVQQHDCFRCVYCGFDGSHWPEWLYLSIDHLVAPEDSRYEDRAYMVSACRYCCEVLATASVSDDPRLGPSEIVSKRRETIARLREDCRRKWGTFIPNAKRNLRRYGVYRAQTWAEAKGVLSSLDGWDLHVFRGQQKTNWPLATSLERCPSLVQGQEETLEEELLRRFRENAPGFLDGALPNDDLSLMALMQHHGSPTRLLDFSRSPWVAAYFAVEEAVKQAFRFDEPQYAAVWIVDTQHLDGRALNMDHGLDDRTVVATWWQKDEFRKLVDGKPGIYHLPPPQKNKRIARQKGSFLFPGDIKLSFEDNLTGTIEPEHLSRSVMKLEIPCDQREAALKELHSMGMCRTRLFPGADGRNLLDSFAQSLRYQVPEVVAPVRPVERVRRTDKSFASMEQALELFQPVAPGLSDV